MTECSERFFFRSFRVYFFQSVQYRGGKSRETFLQDVVVRAFLHACHRDLFSQRTRDEYEGRRVIALLKQSQSLKPIEPRQTVV